MLTYAQTFPQLYRQMRQRRYSDEDVHYLRNVYEFGMQIFAGRCQSNQKSYISHLVGTASVLVSLSVSISVVAAGLLHNVYRQGDFGDGEMGCTPRRREKIRRVVGIEVESYLAAINSMGWKTPLFPLIRDHLKEYGQVEQTVVLIHLADWLEHNFDYGILYYPQSKGGWFRENYEIFLEMISILDLPNLSHAYQQVFKENTAIETLEWFQQSAILKGKRCVPKSCQKGASGRFYAI